MTKFADAAGGVGPNAGHGVVPRKARSAVKRQDLGGAAAAPAEVQHAQRSRPKTRVKAVKPEHRSEADFDAGENEALEALFSLRHGGMFSVPDNVNPVKRGKRPRAVEDEGVENGDEDEAQEAARPVFTGSSGKQNARALVNGGYGEGRAKTTGPPMGFKERGPGDRKPNRLPPNAPHEDGDTTPEGTVGPDAPPHSARDLDVGPEGKRVRQPVRRDAGPSGKYNAHWGPEGPPESVGPESKPLRRGDHDVGAHKGHEYPDSRSGQPDGRAARGPGSRARTTQPGADAGGAPGSTRPNTTTTANNSGTPSGPGGAPWPSGLQGIPGYYPPSAAAQATPAWPGSGAAAPNHEQDPAAIPSTPSMPYTSMLAPRWQWKHCALHVYIAHFIYYQQTNRNAMYQQQLAGSGLYGPNANRGAGQPSSENGQGQYSSAGRENSGPGASPAAPPSSAGFTSQVPGAPPPQSQAPPPVTEQAPPAPEYLQQHHSAKVLAPQQSPAQASSQPASQPALPQAVQQPAASRPQAAAAAPSPFGLYPSHPPQNNSAHTVATPASTQVPPSAPPPPVASVVSSANPGSSTPPAALTAPTAPAPSNAAPPGAGPLHGTAAAAAAAAAALMTCIPHSGAPGAADAASAQVQAQYLNQARLALMQQSGSFPFSFPPGHFPSVPGAPPNSQFAQQQAAAQFFGANPFAYPGGIPSHLAGPHTVPQHSTPHPAMPASSSAPQTSAGAAAAAAAAAVAAAMNPNAVMNQKAAGSPHLPASTAGPSEMEQAMAGAAAAVAQQAARMSTAGGSHPGMVAGMEPYLGRAGEAGHSAALGGIMAAVAQQQAAGHPGQHNVEANAPEAPTANPAGMNQRMMQSIIGAAGARAMGEMQMHQQQQQHHQQQHRPESKIPHQHHQPHHQSEATAGPHQHHQAPHHADGSTHHQQHHHAEPASAPHPHHQPVPPHTEASAPQQHHQQHHHAEAAPSHPPHHPQHHHPEAIPAHQHHPHHHSEGAGAAHPHQQHHHHEAPPAHPHHQHHPHHPEATHQYHHPHHTEPTAQHHHHQQPHHHNDSMSKGAEQVGVPPPRQPPEMGHLQHPGAKMGMGSAPPSAHGMPPGGAHPPYLGEAEASMRSGQPAQE
eukprot:CAMPEP_0197867564 /NCGR_PEP_ID=MMETSP1438-20131217/44823_1 /TAXON_ID=1461541 /ORGANISM="Pterosperma sp., Strain CCMP1384" /LENGTH=1119 /DNA_ID=CAMNT_0043486223 /DNA_START=436 /DNA_END=3795 /DNA_ORIENTATION=-